MCPNKTRPILFSGEMVRAILSGRKTQTRRVLQPSRRKDGIKLLPELLATIGAGHACPYGAVGDRLYVRETWTVGATDGQPLYKATYGDHAPKWHQWRPSIHMPRKYSRIVLEIVDVRVERVQDISPADAIAEGCFSDQSVAAYRVLWNKINAARGYSWEANPWVWVLEFKRIDCHV